MRKNLAIICLSFFFALPVWSQELEATVSSKSVELQWKQDPAREVDHSELERRGRGEQFQMIALVLADGQSNEHLHFYKDKLTGIDEQLYYRLHLFYTDGTDSYSNILSLNLAEQKEELLKISTDINNCKLVLQLPADKGSYLFRIYNMQGQLMDTQRTEGSANELLADKLAEGNYFMEAFHPVTGKRYYGTFSL